MTDLAARPDVEPISAVRHEDPRTTIRVLLSVDAELLLEARRQIQADSFDEAVNEALRRLVEAERAKRRAAGEALDRLVANGVLDGGDE